MIKINPISFANLKQPDSRKNGLSFKLSFIPPKINAEEGLEIFAKCREGNSLPDFLEWIKDVNLLSDKTLTDAFGGTGVKVEFDFFQKESGMGRKKVKKWFVKMFLTTSEQDKRLLSGFSDIALKRRVTYDGKTKVCLKPKKVEGNFIKTLRKQLLEINNRWKNIAEKKKT